MEAGGYRVISVFDSEGGLFYYYYWVLRRWKREDGSTRGYETDPIANYKIKCRNISMVVLDRVGGGPEPPTD